MTIASVHRRGVLAAVLLWGVAAAALAIDVATGILLSVPVLVASLGVPNAVRVFLTRRWPRVEATAWHRQTAALDAATGGGAVARHAQLLSYEYQGQRRETSLAWSTEPPAQVVLRVNPDEPSEVFCLEHAGDGWVSFLLVALLLPPVVGLMVWLGLGRLPRFVAGLALLGGIAAWGRRLLPTDRPDSLSGPPAGATELTS